jgi:Flp pilus assembly protein TadD
LVAEAKAAQEKVAADAAKLKTENARLAQELETVKDIAAAIKAPGSAAPTGPALKPDVGKIADRHYGDALGNLYRGRLLEAESGFRKAIQFKSDDARFHYLLGVVLWSNGNQKDAEEAFKKGHELELAGSPDRRTVSEALERIQGAARQAVNAYRP